VKPSPDPGFFSEQIAEAARFHFDPAPPEKTSLAVVSGGREHCSPDYEIHRKSFPLRGIEFVAQGRGRVDFGKRSFQILPGSVFSYGPRTPHDIVTDASDPLVKYFVDFTGSRAASLLRRHGPAPGTVIQTSSPGEIMALFDDLIRNGQSHTPFSGRIAAIILEHLLLKIAETSIPNGSSGSPAFATYRRCRQHIEDHWAELDSLGQAASSCNVAPAYLCRLFRRFDRQSPYQFLLRLKVNHAAERLLSGEASVADIAGELRFADPFHFSRVFRKIMGIAPSRFVRLSGR
jgi:AraC-like DNA-binding protein